MTRTLTQALFSLLAFVLLPAAVLAEGGDAAAAVDAAAGTKAIGAALAIGLTGLGTGHAMARIGAAGVGAVAEDQKNLANSMVLLVIPESILIFGFVIAFLIK